MSLSEPTYLVLLALEKKPLHGYGIIKKIELFSEGFYELAPGTLYGVLKNLKNQKVIEVVDLDLDNRNKKIYSITEKGRNLLINEKNRYERLLNFTYTLRNESE